MYLMSSDGVWFQAVLCLLIMEGRRGVEVCILPPLAMFVSSGASVPVYTD